MPPRTTLLTSTATDWTRAFRMASLWSNLALEDLRDRYRRSVFGIAWIVLSFTVFVAVKVAVFGQMVPASTAEFGLYVTIGFGLWSYINSMVTDACSAYMHARPWILGTSIPYPVFLLQATLRNWLIFGLILLVMAVALLWKPDHWSLRALYALPALLAYLVTSVWLAAILAPLCARFRDLYHAIQTAMRLFFFVTPILWMPSMSEVLNQVARWNPMTHYIEIVRDPLLYDRLPTSSWSVVLAINAVGLLAGMAVYASTRNKVAHWV